jgi:hypothetical protein
VLALAISGSTVYAGGIFTGIGGQTRNRIAALDAATGLSTIWNPNANNTVRALAVSGSTVYAGGDFTTIGGQTRNRIAAIDAATGLPTSWNPNANGTVHALAVSGSTVYTGGGFTSIGAQTRNYIAALDAATGLATSWNPNANLPFDVVVYALAISFTNSKIYAGGNFTSIMGESRTGFAGMNNPFDPPTTSVRNVEVGHVPQGFALSQNYPNPFNPSTTLSFNIPYSSFVILKVYNVLGQEVATLVNEEIKPGSYETTFSGAGLSSGIYFYRLQAGGFVQTKKLVLQK